MPCKNYRKSKSHKNRNKDIDENIPLIKTYSESQYFRDGVRKIDAILIYKTEEVKRQRIEFLNNLKDKELSIEEENFLDKFPCTCVKIHAPNNVLKTYAKKCNITPKFERTSIFPEPNVSFNFMKNILNDPKPNENRSVSQRAWETISKAKPLDYTTAERSSIVFYILNNTKFGSMNPFDVGLPRLLHQEVFIAAYPLHDGPWRWTKQGSLSDRQLLARYWANSKAWYKQQPLNTIEKYFGYEIAMFFCWLGFYNKMLIIASIMGILTIIFGFINLSLLVSNPIQEACSSDIYICPYCKTCKPQQLKKFCIYYKYAVVNDNIGSVIFACLMSLWATILMELWKREEAVHNLQWNMQLAEEDYGYRPEFQANVSEMKVNQYTGEKEPIIPLRQRMRSVCISISVVAFMILVILSTIFSIILYECVLKLLNINQFLIMLSSSFLTLAVMLIVRKIYGAIAIRLTIAEIPRTQTEFDKSYMIKMIIFSVINNYGKLIYIAFFKGKFFTYPGDPKMRYFPMAAEVCNPTGCITELFWLLAIITIFKPIISNIVDISSPMFNVWRNELFKKIRLSSSAKPCWIQDYNLNPSNDLNLLTDFEEIVMQYGFVTFLVGAFPLAPLLALINNQLEIRIDAIKLLKYYRRPEPKRFVGFGIWFDTLQGMTYFAVITNALFITFTSNFIPQMVYQNEYKQSLEGFINFTLSEYEIKDNYWTNTDIKNCWYLGYRYPPSHENAYQKTFMYYYILSCRLGFAIIFLVCIFILTGIVAYAIPNIPRAIREQMTYNARKSRELA